MPRAKDYLMHPKVIIASIAVLFIVVGIGTLAIHLVKPFPVGTEWEPLDPQGYYIVFANKYVAVMAGQMPVEYEYDDSNNTIKFTFMNQDMGNGIFKGNKLYLNTNHDTKEIFQRMTDREVEKLNDGVIPTM